MAYLSLEKKIGEILIKRAGLKSADLEEVLRIQKESQKKIGDILIEKNLLNPDDIGKALAFQLGLPFVEEMDVESIDPNIVAHISIQFCREHLVLPIEEAEGRIRVAMVDPFNNDPVDALKLLFDKEIEIVLVNATKLYDCINRVFEKSENSVRGLDVSTEDYDDELLHSSTMDLLEAGDDAAPVVRFVRTLLSRAIKEKASDIHIEPFENKLSVRFRVDGILYDVYEAPKKLAAPLASGIKIMSELNIAEKRIPQDGRFKIKVGSREIDIRLSVVPVQNGERLVMRLLDKSSVILDLVSLGFDDREIKVIKQITNKKHGIFLITGPTGSGKSTTLASVLKIIASPERNVITVEDPIEHQLPGVGQIAVNHKVGLNFATGLRSILRQDPDVVMVGEIRDQETADIAVNASLTGHFVLSTLHTNDAPGAVSRLMDMDVEPFLVSSSMVGVLAQRLMRKVCQICATDYEPSEAELEGLGLSKEEIFRYTNGKQLIVKKAHGCSQCRNSGYSDRTVIVELMVMSDAIRQLILEKEDAAVIKKQAIADGMKTLRVSAMEKLIAGKTTIEEIARSTHEEESK